MPDRTGIDHSWDRNSDRAHLLLAQNRNKMQCDGLRNVWCSHCANNFCLAFRFQYFFPPRAPSLHASPHLTSSPPTHHPIDQLERDFIYFIATYNTAKRLSSAARVKSVSLNRRLVACSSFWFRYQPTLAFTNIRKCIEDESRRRRSIEHLFLISFHFNKGAWALSIFKRFPCCGRSRKKRWILTDKN